MVFTDNEKQTVSWIPITPLGVALLFILMGIFIQWGMSKVPHGIPPGTQRSVWLFYLLALIFAARGIWGMRWFKKTGDTLQARSLFKKQDVQAENSVVYYRSGSSLPGTSNAFLILIEFATSPQSVKKVPVRTFLCGWVFGLIQGRQFGQALQQILGVSLEPQLTDTSPPPMADTIKKLVIIIPLAVIIILLVNLFILYIR